MAIVVSHIADTFDQLAARAQRQAALADLIELRLDRIGHPGEGELKRFISQVGKPVIVAVHGAEAFGSYSGSVDERCELLLAAARAGAKFVDIDWSLSLELGPIAGKCHRIVSRHDREGTPLDLATFDEEVRAVLHEGDVVKLVAHANCAEDGLRMLQWLRQARGGLVAFSSGPAGSFTRVLAPIFGSPFTYAAPANHLPGDVPETTAPGQLRVNDLRALLPPGGLSPETAIFAVLGRPIAHSLSPRVQGMALKAAHLDAVFLAIEPRDFAQFLQLASADSFRGFSVTAPFKEEAWRAAAHSDASAMELQAANTLVRAGTGWRAHNTDRTAVGETLERAFRHHANLPGRPLSLALARALVLGTGGAARAALGALAQLNVQSAVAGRRVGPTRELAARFRARAVVWEELEREPYDILIHCTPHGMAGEPDPVLPLGAIRPETLVLDAVYRPLLTPLLQAAKERRCTVVPGAEWFVRQAREQYRLFTGQTADEKLLRTTFEHALGLTPKT